MDHLPFPSDREPLHITVPYIADQVPPYDGGEWMTFPGRRGYDIHPPKDNDGSEWARHELLEVQAFFQSWMYFGLLEDVFGDLDFFSYRHFIHPSDMTHDFATISTTELSAYIHFKLENCFRSQDEEYDNVKPRAEERRVALTLATSVHQMHEWEVNAKYKEETWIPILLSSRILIETLYSVFVPTVGKCPRAASLSSLPSMEIVKKHMLNHNWCIHQINTLCSQLSFLTLLYLANLRRHQRPGVSHSACESEDRCIAYNINDETFECKHIQPGCTCDHITAPKEDLARIIRSGGIPVLRCERRSSGHITVKYIRASPGLSYTALSHLWADGLGNPSSNSLPECQLQHIVTQVEQATPVVLTYGFFGESFPKPRNFILAVRNLLSWSGAFLTRKAVVNIWLDVYCVPALLLPTGRDTSTPEAVHPASLHEDLEQEKLLKSAAISRMAATYSWANYVLVLDEELSRVNLSGDFTEVELLARIATSAWNTRCWTYQEHAVGRIAAYQLNSTVTFRCVPEMSVTDIRFWSATTKRQQGKLYGMHRDLDFLAFPGHVNTGATVDIRRARVYEQWRAQDPEIRRFTNTWNAFFGRTTTKPDDLMGIFANLLDLNASQFMALGQDVKMKAILASHARLPLSLLLVDVKRRSRNLQSKPETQDLCERWIPTSPQSTTPLWDRTLGIDLGVTPKGLMLRTGKLQRVGHLLLILAPIQEGEQWVFQAGIERYWVTCDRRELESCLTENAEKVILVLDTSFLDGGGDEPYLGACLLPRSSEEVGPTTVIYVCTVQWGFVRNRSSADESMAMTQAKIMGADDSDILLLTDLGVKRTQLVDGWNVKSDEIWSFFGLGTVLLYIVLFLASCVLDTPRVMLAAYGIFFACVAIAFIVNGMVRRALRYLLLHSMQAEADTSRPWWEQLGETLSASGPDLGMSIEKIQVDGLRVIVAVVRLFVWAKARYLHIRHPDEEGRISLD